MPLGSGGRAAGFSWGAPATLQGVLWSDGLSGQYSSTRGGAESQADELLSQAQKHLQEEKLDEALQTATEAMEAFKKASQFEQAASALTTLTTVYKMRHEAGEGASIAVEELTQHELRGDALCVGMATLALAEVSENLDEAIELAADAKEEFVKLKNTTMEIKALLLMTQLTIERSGKPGATIAVKLKEAKELANQALAKAIDIGSKELTGKAWHAYAEACSKSGAGDDAVRAVKKAIGLFQECGLKKEAAMAMYFAAGALKDMAQLSEASNYASDGMTAFADLGLPIWQARCANVLVGCLLLEDRVQQATTVVDSIASIGKDKGSPLLEALAMQMKCSCALRADDLSQASNCMMEAQRLVAASGDRREEANVLNASASVHFKLGDAAEAQNAASEAMAIFKELGDHQAAASALLLSNSFLVEEDAAGGLKAAQTAKEVFRQQGDLYNEGMALVQVAVANGFLAKASKAVLAAEHAVDIFNSLGCKVQEAAAREILLDIYVAAKEFDRGIDEGKQARIALKGSQGSKQAEIEVCKKLAQAYLGKDETQEAIRVAQQGVNLAKDSKNEKMQVMMLNTLSHITMQGLVNEVNSGSIPADPKSPKFLQMATAASNYAKEGTSMARLIKGKPENDGQVLLGNLLYTNAQCLSMTAKAQEALTSLGEAMPIFEALDDSMMQGWCQLLSADCSGSLGKTEAALEAADGALKIFQALGDKEAINQCKAAVDKYRPKQVITMAAGGGGGDAASGAGGAMTAVNLSGPNPGIVRQRILDIAKEIVGDDEGIDGDSPLMDSGMDSLSGLDFRGRLSKEFSMNMPSTMVFEYPSIARLTDFLVETMEESLRDGKLTPEQMSTLAALS